jgi:ribonuclease HI
VGFEIFRIWHILPPENGGASSQQGSGAGVAVINPQGDLLNYALHLMFHVTNNVTEYEAMIVGLKLVKELGAREVRLYSDSQLAVRQINEEIRVIDDNLLKYKDQLSRIKEYFDKVDILHIPRGLNSQADALSKLAASGNLDKDWLIIIMEIPKLSIDVSILEVFPVKEEVPTWFTPIWEYLTRGVLPGDKLLARRLRRISPMYAILNGQLYKRGYLRPWLKCVREEKAKELLAEIHEGIYGSHQRAKTLAKWVLWASYYWPTVHQDATSFVRKCEKCQINSRLTHILPAKMITIAGAWPFDLWGIDIFGPFSMAAQ